VGSDGLNYQKRIKTVISWGDLIIKMEVESLDYSLWLIGECRTKTGEPPATMLSK